VEVEEKKKKEEEEEVSRIEIEKERKERDKRRRREWTNMHSNFRQPVQAFILVRFQQNHFSVSSLMITMEEITLYR